MYMNVQFRKACNLFTCGIQYPRLGFKGAIRKEQIGFSSRLFIFEILKRSDRRLSAYSIQKMVYIQFSVCFSLLNEIVQIYLL